MFPLSTQCKEWMFKSEEELAKLRENNNLLHIQNYGRNVNEAHRYEFFLTAEEERIVLHKYELNLKDFCKRFQPAMPRCVIGTAFHYFKRFYIHNSVMNYHPKEIMVTCVFLACKVEEFYVPMSQFVANIKGDREKASDIILNNELLLMQQLNFHLAIHNPYRPVEGLLIDIKTRCTLNDPERLRPGTELFLERVLVTDAILLYSPSQVALAAVLHAASKLQENLDSYVTDTLFGVEGQGKLEELIEAVRSIRSMEKAVDAIPDKVQQKLLEKKLDRCRNPENNPDSEIYKKRMQAMLYEDEEMYNQVQSDRENLDNSALGMNLSPYEIAD